MKATRWFLAKIEGRPVIKRELRHPDGKIVSQRYPIKEYKHLLKKEPELRRLVLRLNNQDSRKLIAQEKLRVRDAFFTEEDLEEFKKQLLARFSSEKNALDLFQLLQKYSLSFFLSKGKVSVRDMKLNEFEWGQALIGASDVSFGKRLSPKTIKVIVNVTNNFLQFLSKKYADIQPLRLEPLSRAQMKNYMVAYRQEGVAKTDGRYLPEDEFNRIVSLAKLSGPGIAAAISLGYRYGLRKSEILGLQPKDVKKGYLSVERQAVKATKDTLTFGPLKDRENRRVDHLWLTPIECAGLVKQLNENRPTASQLGHFFDRELLKHDIKIDIHSLRRSFITNALLKGIEPQKVQFMAGHSDITTTSKYVRDARQWASDDDQVILAD